MGKQVSPQVWCLHWSHKRLVASATSQQLTVKCSQVGRFAIPGDSGSLVVDASSNTIIGIVSQIVMEEQPLPNGNKRLVFINRNIVTPLWTFFDWMRDLLIEANDESDLDCSQD